jgi:hypothetical protein
LSSNLIRLEFLTGSRKGSAFQVERFPCLAGRSPQADLRIKEKGVWDRHFQVLAAAGEGIRLRAEPEAFLAVNGSRVQETFLKNGDVIEAGAAKLLFSLSPPKPRSLVLREGATWIGLVLLLALQGALIYWISS